MGILQALMNETQPWFSVFLKTSCFCLPQSLSQCDTRVLSNVKFFKGNYVAIATLLFLYNVITNVILMFVIALMLAMYYLLCYRYFRGKAVRRRHCLVGLGFLSVALCYMAGMRMVFVYTTEMTFVIVLCHALLYNQELLSVPCNGIEDLTNVNAPYKPEVNVAGQDVNLV